ncbi:MAG: 7-carboxy-7-deazaguanine synthase QueE [Solitalea-like symbiont of Tyrophagus putrescentiae]
MTEFPIMEHFYTLQGEGRNSGVAAYFIRLAGCDVGCHWCDVKESWDATKHTRLTIDSLIEQVSRSKASNVVITGGEPLMYNLDYLCRAFKERNVKTFIETSGSGKLSGFWDWVVLSPKKTKLPVDNIYKHANELKMIIYNNDDFKFAEQQAQKVSDNCMLFMQPEWSKKNIIMNTIIDYIKDNPKWRLSLQTHKYIDIP